MKTNNQPQILKFDVFERKHPFKIWAFVRFH